MAEEVEPSKMRRRAKAPWKSSVTSDEFFLVGSSNGGFLELEEIDEKDYLVAGEKAAGRNGFEEAASATSGKKKRKRREKPGNKGRVDGSETIQANRKKKCKTTESSGQPSVSGEGDLEEKCADSKKRKCEEEMGKGECGVIAAESDGSLYCSREKDGKVKLKKIKKKKRDNKKRKDRCVSGSTAEIEDVPNDNASAFKDDNNEVLLGDDDLQAWRDLRLHPLLIKALQRLGFREPTPIQKACFPAAAHKGKDVIGAAQTGSGKTLAFGLPILQRLLEEQCKKSDFHPGDAYTVNKNASGNALRALIVTPTRELAFQVRDHLKDAAKFLGIDVAAVVGGMFAEKQERVLKRRPHIIVGTPGRLWELMSEGNQHLTELEMLSFFVLDEADRMIEKGHFKELQSIIDMLPTCHGSVEQTMESSGCESVPILQRKKRQTFLFSATIALSNNFRKKLQRGHKLANSDSISTMEALSERAGLRPDVAVIDLTSASIVANKLEESFIECPEVDKDAYLYYILSVHGSGRTIVFCTSIAALRHLTSILNILGINALSHHAQMQQRARFKAMDRFRANQNAVLIASDGAARGLDIENVRTVVHYQLPHSAEVYIHRSGRTARVASDGCSVALISSADKSKFQALCSSLSKESLKKFPVDNAFMPEIMKRVSLARQIDKIMRQTVQKNVKKNWIQKNAESAGLDFEASESEEERVQSSRAQKATVSQLKKLQQELKERLSHPLQPKSFSHRFLAGAGVTPLLQQQLKQLAEKNIGSNASLNGRRKSGFLVIGQDCIEPLQALRDSGVEISVSGDEKRELRKLADFRKRKKLEDKKRERDQRRKLKKSNKEQQESD